MTNRGLSAKENLAHYVWHTYASAPTVRDCRCIVIAYDPFKASRRFAGHETQRFP